MSFQVLRTNLFILSLAIVLYFGWSHRDDNYLTAETGTGYVLGIIGGSLMILLLLYPLSKRLSLLTRWIPIRYWFGIHMLFGIIGPTMILFHSNFHLGSTNSNIALICMLLVAFSGVIGRYIYVHIHHGLYGAKITLNELKQEIENKHTNLLETHAIGSQLLSRLETMEQKALQPYSNLVSSMKQLLSLSFAARAVSKDVSKLLKGGFEPVAAVAGQAAGTDENVSVEVADSKTVMSSVNRYTRALRRTAKFKLYERLFSLWHVLHLPLFIMMIITAVIHIFAVHMY